MRTPIDAHERLQAALFEHRLVQTVYRHVRRCELAFLHTTRATFTSLMDERTPILAKNLRPLMQAKNEVSRSRPLAADRTLQMLVADLMAARIAAGMTQEQVAARMWTTKSAISRLEGGVRTRPTLRTIERYALAVGARVEIRVRAAR